ncbi:MAG: extracellular solute-binding protein, partial [Anaerolineaceae bacterium]|nr:extracellular solute-binding protein [Anaerolineaceae bacterium]
MKKMKPLEKLYMWIIIIFMYAPILTLIVLSFNKSKSRARWGGFTFNWYIRLFSDSAVLNALANTLIIALIATIVATIIGTVTSVALVGLNRKTRAVIMGITNIPMINADIVTGISLMLLFRVLHFHTGFITVLIAHITFNIPYVMLSVMPRMKTISPSVYEAALDLGAEPWFAFRKTVLPDLMPAVLSGALMAFTMSIDDFIITYFTKGSGFDTLSTKIYNEVKRGIQPEIYALSAIIFVVVLILLFASNRMQKSQSKPVELTEQQIKNRKIRNYILVTAAGLGIIYLALLFGGVFSKNSNQVFVYNAGEYIDPEVIQMFQEETGIEVVYDEFETNEIMYAKIAADPSSYDVICPSDYMISKLISMDMLETLDFAELPNAMEHIGEQYYQSAESFDPGNQYAVPYMWGTIGILYNKTMVHEPVTSWNILWDEKYAGEILMQDSIRDAFMIPMARRGFSFNTTDPAEIEIAVQDLIAQSPLVQAYVVDQVRDKMIGNEAALGVIYSGEAIYTQRENPDLEYVIPDEGSNVWIDAWVITKDARNKENALKWIDFLCRPEIALMNFDFITYSTPNVTARELIEDEDIRNSSIAFPDEETLSRCDTFIYLGEEGDKLYSEAWKRVKS